MDHKLEMTKILVTGSSGLVGSQVVKDLLERNFEVYSGYNAEKPKEGIATKLDLVKKDSIVEAINNTKPDTIIHLAAITNVDLCETQKELTNTINATATEILVQESAKRQAFFIYMSTDYVFDGKMGLKNEDDLPNPINFYGRSKLAGEIATRNFAALYSIVRTSTPFGIHDKKKSFPIWVKENLKSKKEISVFIDQYTSPTFVPNLSEMLIEVYTKKIPGIIHLAGATRISRYEFAKMLAQELDLDETLLKPKRLEDASLIAARPQDSSLDVSQARKILNNKPQEIQQSLGLFVNQIKKT